MPVPLYPFEAWFDNVALGALCSKATLKNTYDLAQLAIRNRIPGDFVECGVYGGAQCAVMARAIMDNEHRAFARRVHLFDSFTGIPKPGPNDLGWTHPEGTSACSLESCKAHMKEWSIPDELLVWHPGLFTETLKKTRFENQIAVLRLDGDLYESTLVCLEQLYPLVPPGGYIIVDDYALPGCRKAVDDYFGSIQAPITWQKQ